MFEELIMLYYQNLEMGMNQADAYTEAYSVICNKYDDDGVRYLSLFSWTAYPDCHSKSNSGRKSWKTGFH